MKYFYYILAFVPLVSIAQEEENKGPDIAYFQTAGEQFFDLLQTLLPIVVTLALLFFFWNAAKFILNAGKGGERQEAKNTLVWGVIALFVMVSVWGLVGFIGDIFGIKPGGSAPVPGVQAPERDED